jgi:CDP-6-deoxy-D-xylo-4-hexulose-3-dehydrase
MGYNFKITDMQAACGLAQLNKIEGFIKKRVDNFNYLYSLFSKSSEYFILPEKTKNSEPSWFGFLLTIKDNKINRNELLKFLDQKKIGTRLLFSGNVTKQPYMLDKKYIVHKNLKNTDKVMNDSFWLGVYPGLDKVHLDYMYNSVIEFLKKN